MLITFSINLVKLKKSLASRKVRCAVILGRRDYHVTEFKETP
jgi:hypothetical protein